MRKFLCFVIALAVFGGCENSKPTLSKQMLEVTSEKTGGKINKIRILFSMESETGRKYFPTDINDPRTNRPLAQNMDPSEAPVRFDIDYAGASFETPNVRLQVVGFADGTPVARYTGMVNMSQKAITKVKMLAITQACDADKDSFPDCSIDSCCNKSEVAFISDCHPNDSAAFPWSNTEICDGLDNDCNGETDEGIPGIGDNCDNGGIGACRSEGILVCTGGSLPTCNAPNTSGWQCDDGNACTENDQCWSGACSSGELVTCDDDDVCNGIESCDKNNGCILTEDPLECDDDNACNGKEGCDAADGCVAGMPIECDDNDVCNGLETCDAADGCLPGNMLACDDNDPCTIDSCDPTNGCTYLPNPACTCQTDAACDDANVCNGIETCDKTAFTCLPGTALDCDDGNICTDESCDAASGCVSVNNTAACDDKDACTATDLCSDGACIGSDPIACAASDQCHDAGVCDSTTGECSNPALANGTACEDGDVCSDADTCQNGVCAPGVQLICNDEDPCTADSCDAADGCAHEALADCGTVINAGPYMDTISSEMDIPYSYIMDETEVTVEQYAACVSAGGCTAPGTGGNCTWPAQSDHPVTCLGFNQAEDYCAWMNGRLPTQREWEKAARGGCDLFGVPGCDAAEDHRIYPWGNIAPTCAEAHFKESVATGCGTQQTAPVGTHSIGNSSYGLADMAGNVWEIVSTAGCSNDLCCLPGEVRICGGGYTSASGFLQIEECRCGPNPVSDGIGLRCAYD